MGDTMGQDEIKAMAGEAIDSMRQEALHDGIAHADASGPRRLEQACASLRAHVAAPGSANPAYDCLGEMTANLILLAATDPETYGILVGGIGIFEGRKVPPSLSGEGKPPGTLRGLVAMQNLVRAIADDHEWALDRSGEVPVVRMQHDIVPFEPTFSPRSMLDALRPLMDRASAPAGPRPR